MRGLSFCDLVQRESHEGSDGAQTFAKAFSAEGGIG